MGSDYSSESEGGGAGCSLHIYAPCDANNIRNFLIQVISEQSRRPDPQNDPLHDQTWYLDDAGVCVEGCDIIQCLGNAVFIPAGAPHQVRNLHSCIKSAEDCLP